MIIAGLATAAAAGAVTTGTVPFVAALGGTTAAAEPGLAGTVASDALIPFAIASATAPVSGTLQVRVVRNSAGKLAFYWKINNAPASKGSVETFSVAGFPKQPYDANWRKDGLGTVAPSSVEGAFSAADLKSWILGFRFTTPIEPGRSSRFFFLRSGASKTVPAVAHVTGAGGASGDLAVSAPAG